MQPIAFFFQRWASSNDSAISPLKGIQKKQNNPRLVCLVNSIGDEDDISKLDLHLHIFICSTRCIASLKLLLRVTWNSSDFGCLQHFVFDHLYFIFTASKTQASCTI